MGCDAVMATVDARALAPHDGAAALSLPARHPNGSAHDGQPVPTYSTVLLAVWPHVVSVSVPPSGVVEPRSSAYSSREPGKKALRPLAHVPEVYMPGCPATATDSGGAVPLVPDSSRTSGSPRQTGSVGDGDGVRGGAEALDETVAVELKERMLDELGDAVPDGLPVRVALLEPVPVELADAVPDGLPVRVALLEPVAVELADAVPVTLPVVVALTPDRLRSDAMLRPRNTGMSKLPSAASQELSADGFRPLFHPFVGTSWVMFDSNTQGAEVIVALV